MVNLDLEAISTSNEVIIEQFPTNYGFREFVSGSIYHSNDLKSISDSIETYGKNEQYQSYYILPQEIKEYISNNQGRLAGYTGAVNADYLIIDIDDSNLGQALNLAKTLLKSFEAKYEIDPGHIRTNFSGSKGFHIRIPAQLFGGFEYSQNLPDIHKNIAKELTQGIITIDESIYKHIGLIRIINSINQKSGLVAIPLTYREVSDLSIEQIMEMAKSPRTVEYIDPEDINTNESFATIKNEYSKAVKSGEIHLSKGISSEEITDFWSPKETGNRHDSLTKIVGHLIKNGLPDSSIRVITKLWNTTNNPPKEETLLNKEVEDLLKSYGKIKGEFWQIIRKQGSSPKIDISELEYLDFLSKIGFGKYYLKKGFEFVYIQKNIVHIVQSAQIKDYVLEYLKNLNNNSTPFKEQIQNVMISKSSHYLNDNKLELIKPVEVNLMRDTKDNARFFYKNCIVNISRDNGVTVEDYSNLDGLIWDTQVIQREFILDTQNKSIFEKFLLNVCRESVERLKSFKSMIGYLLHNYKDRANAKAIVLCDEKIPENGEPNGRTGKSLFGEAISRMKNSIRMDGKNINFTDKFAFQQIELNTEIMEFNDVNRAFNFERLFSVITDSITVEKKNGHAFSIPFERSPKILISTNYTLKGVGDSYNARMLEIEFSDYYNSRHQPIDDFKHRFFDEWDEPDWNKFDNFMISCVLLYLRESLVVSEPINIELRKLIDNTKPEFVEFAESELTNNLKINKNKFLESFKNSYPDFGRLLTQRTFTEWVRAFANYKGYNCGDLRSNSNSYYILRDSENDPLTEWNQKTPGNLISRPMFEKKD